MGDIVLAGATSGTTTLTPTAVSGTTTLTLPATTGTVVTKDTNGILSVNGVQFPATQSASADANTLDDYEEGTWTPAFLTGVTSPTYSEQTGAYIKIGRFVSFSVRIVLSGGTGNGALVQLSGLPFTSSSATGVRGSAVGTYIDASTLVLAVDISTASTTISCYQYGGSNYIFAGSLASKYFYICGSYYTLN